MSNKVKVPGGAFYVGDGLTVDPITRTVSAGGGGGASGVNIIRVVENGLYLNNEFISGDVNALASETEIFNVGSNLSKFTTNILMNCCVQINNEFAKVINCENAGSEIYMKIIDSTGKFYDYNLYYAN